MFVSLSRQESEKIKQYTDKGKEDDQLEQFFKDAENDNDRQQQIEDRF